MCVFIFIFSSIAKWDWGCQITSAFRGKGFSRSKSFIIYIPRVWRKVTAAAAFHLSVWACATEIRAISTHGESGEGHLHVGVDQILHLAGERSFHVGHQGRVHFGQSVRPVNPHNETRPLTLHGNTLGQQQVPAKS